MKSSDKHAAKRAGAGVGATVQRDGFLRRQCACGAHTLGASTCSACGKSRSSAGGSGIQAKLRLGAVDDPLEAEADRVSEQVLAAPQPGMGGVQAAAPSIQRGCAAGPQQATQEPAQDSVPASVDQVLSGAGSPLESGLRHDMEGRFQRDFSGVRVHADGAAQRSAQEIDARAYTAGNHVVFGAGQFAPASSEGRSLLAHELTHVVQQGGAATPGVASRALVQRAPALPDLFPPLRLPSDSTDLADTDSASAANPALLRIAAAYKAQPGAYMTLSGFLKDSARLSSSGEVEERSRMLARLNAVRGALEALGVPGGAFTVEAPTQFSSTKGGWISVKLYKDKPATAALPGASLNPIGPAAPPKSPLPAGPQPAAPSTGSGLPNFAEMLSFKFTAGAVQFAVALPKSVSAKLPVKLGVAKVLAFELKATSSGDFSFSISLNGLRHINVAATAKVSVDKDKGTSGSAGLEIQATRTVCSVANPAVLQATLTASGEKLKTAIKELESAPQDERLAKMAAIAGVIGEMYDAVDQSKAACKEVPAATLNIGVQGPLAPTNAVVNDPDPMKRPAATIGIGLTIPF